MKILYIAYSCDPYNGSEDQIGWNIPLESAKLGNEVFVITKEEQRFNIEKYCKKEKYNKIKFFYVDINKIYKKIYRGMLYSGRIMKWNKKVYRLVEQIVNKEKIDIIHQITPIEFRAIGNYGNIENIKYVVGPIGGAICIPKALESYSRGHKTIELFRKMINRFYYLKLRFGGNLKKCDYIYSSNEETKKYLNLDGNCEIMTDLGRNKTDVEANHHKIGTKMVFLSAGRLIYIKGHEFLFDAIKKLEKYNYDFIVRIVGEGPNERKLKKIVENDQFLKKHIVFVGKIKYHEMIEEYKNCDIFLFTSIRDNTGTVLLESMENGLPVISIDAFGGKLLVNNDNGFLYSGNSKNEIINSLAEKIKYCLDNPEEVLLKGNKSLLDSKKFFWHDKVKIINDKYIELLNK